MRTFELMRAGGHDQVAFCYHKASGLKGIIAIHNTTLGPALGSVSVQLCGEEEALRDVLRMSKEMTRMNAALRLDYGGGGAVVIGAPPEEKEKLLRTFGRFVETLGGRYIATPGTGVSADDTEWVQMETRFVVGLTSGDLSPFIALGVYWGMKACVEKVKPPDERLRVAVQGVRDAGYHLVKKLREEGAEVTVADPDQGLVQRVVSEFGATAVAPEDIYDTECHVFAPCAQGGVINDQTLGRLKCLIVAGAAQGQLADRERHGEALHYRRILYAPDCLIGGGGVISLSDERERGGYSRTRVEARVKDIIYNQVAAVIGRSKEKGVPTYQALDSMVEERLQKVGEMKRFFVPERPGRASVLGDALMVTEDTPAGVGDHKDEDTAGAAFSAT